MLALVLDTSSAAVTAGLVMINENGPRLLAERVSVNARGHAELLVPAIADCLREIAAAPADVEAVIAGVGPGPFTGLRVGLMTATAVADARGIPTYGVCSLDAIAAGIDHSGALLVAGDARRREVYWATYQDGSRTSGPAVSKPAELIGAGQAVTEAVELTVAVTAMAGAGARLYADVLGSPPLGLPPLGLPLLDSDYPTCLGLAMVAAEPVRRGAPSEPLTPLYLRRPDAVVPDRLKPVRA